MNTKFRTAAAILLASLSTYSYANNMYMGPSLFIVDNQASGSSFRGFYPRLSFGYTMDILEDIYLAGEIFAVAATGTLDDNHQDGNLSAKSDRSYGFSVLPGFSINNNTMGFFRLGFVTSNFTGPNIYRSGVQWGLGLQTVLSPYWDLRAEYIYTTYRTVASLGAVKTDQVGLGLVYKIL